ncbi:MAG: HAD hydrolase-like protein [Desulfobacterales bacterium]|jgi:phosphoglycolate phosphatase-like HAD superfamily hydrolase
MKSKNLIVFDMDGVIIDVSNSYRDTVRHTIKLFFRPAPNAARMPEPLFDLSDLAGLKQSGGLNNDWDLSYQAICLLFTLVEKPNFYDTRDPWSTYRRTLSGCDLSKLADYLNSTDGPLMTLLNQHGKIADPLIARFYRGDVGSGNIIKQIFQEIYLGEELFISTYGLTPEMYNNNGYIIREEVLIDRPILDEFSEINHLAIATGRPEAEAEYPLDHFKLRDYFDIVYSLDDCLKEEKRILDEEGKEVSLSKPDPYMLDAIAEKYEDQVTGFYYVGDMPDDMVAAGRSRFGYKSIGILISAPDKISLKNKLFRAGADYIVDDFEALKEIIL